MVQKGPIPPMRCSCRESWQLKKFLSNLSANEHKVAKLQNEQQETACLGYLHLLVLPPIAYLIDNLMTGFVNCINTANQSVDHNKKLPVNLAWKRQCDTVKSIKTKLTEEVFA